MESVPDWLHLWRELVEARARGRAKAKVDEHSDVWHARARTYDQAVQLRWAAPDSSRNFIAADLQQHPGDTVLDIGAGTGAWTVFLAQRARHVTALDPSPAMLGVLRQNVASADLGNISVVEGAWPETDITTHAVVLCFHALYGVADFEAFVRKMEVTARRRCYLLLRITTPDGVMTEAAQHVWGQPYDSPNFQVAYNGLLQLGIFASVLVEDSGLWRPWIHASLDDALAEAKRRFDLMEDDTYDAFLRDLLARRLTEVNGEWVWPRGTRSALVYWDVKGVHYE